MKSLNIYSLITLISSSALVVTGAALLALKVGRRRKIATIGKREITLTTSEIIGIIMVILAIMII